MPPTSSKSRSRARLWIADRGASLALLGRRVWRGFLRFTAGGRWADRLPSPGRRNLRRFWFEGICVSASDSIVVAYLSLFVLALGGTPAQIGLMSALSSLSAALLLLPGAALAERWGQRKLIVLLSGKGVSRLVLLLLALTPLVLAGPPAIAVAIALAIVHSAFNNLGVPAWTSLTADLVPLAWRGRYFSARNIAKGLAKIAVTYLVGLCITSVGDPIGYQLAMGLAFAFGVASTLTYASVSEPPARETQPPEKCGSRPSLLRDVRAYPEFLAFCATAALWSFSLQTAAPFFNVYLVDELRATASVVGALSMIAPVTALPGERLFGRLVDRWGPRRVRLVTGLLIPVLPWAWLLVGSPAHVVPINLAGGFLWAGFNLASFNCLLTLMPEDGRERYTALYHIIVMAALAGGAAIGGVIAEHVGYGIVFALSGIGRLAAALLFTRLARERGKVKGAAGHGQSGE